MLKTLRLEYMDEPSPVLKRARLFLDDVDISSFVYGLDISMGIDKVTDVTLYCRGIVELPEDLQALVKVEVDKAEEVDKTWVDDKGRTVTEQLLTVTERTIRP